jgi:hypothetical protein
VIDDGRIVGLYLAHVKQTPGFDIGLAAVPPIARSQPCQLERWRHLQRIDALGRHHELDGLGQHRGRCGKPAVRAPASLPTLDPTLTLSAALLAATDFCPAGSPTERELAALGSLELVNVTFARNVAAGTNPESPGSCLAVGGQAPVAIRNTIVIADAGAACFIVRPKSGDYNLDDDGSCGFGGVGDRPAVNPLLGPRQNNGGPTNTHALSPAGPAIGGADLATCSGTDQRGVARPQQGACDIGCVRVRIPDAESGHAGRERPGRDS